MYFCNKKQESMTENSYIKQFSDLMAGKKILYVHGFASSGQSGTVTRLRTVFPNATVIAPDLPIHPEEALSLLYNICKEEKPDLIIGTSMGGMFTEKLNGFDRICVNPAMQMAETMKEHGMTGTQTFQNPRKDGIQEIYVDKALVKEYKGVTEKNFKGQNEEQHVWGLFGDEDTTVNTYDMFREHYPQATRFHGEHRMNDHSFMHSVVPVIRWIDDQQEKRQRPIIYICLLSKGREPCLHLRSRKRCDCSLNATRSISWLTLLGKRLRGWLNTLVCLHGNTSLPRHGWTCSTVTI